MVCLVYIYNIYKSIINVVVEINNESINILNEYGGVDDL